MTQNDLKIAHADACRRMFDNPAVANSFVTYYVNDKELGEILPVIVCKRLKPLLADWQTKRTDYNSKGYRACDLRALYTAALRIVVAIGDRRSRKDMQAMLDDPKYDMWGSAR